MHPYLIFLVYTYRCPTDFPNLERHEQSNHGDVCRKSEGCKGGKCPHKCPDGCTSLGKSPWCQESFQQPSGSPCRVPKGYLVFTMICMIDMYKV